MKIPVKPHVPMDTIKILELMYVIFVRLSVKHVQDRIAINVRAVLLVITRVQQKLALLVHLSVVLAQEELMKSAQLVLPEIIFSLLLMILLVRRHVLMGTIQTLERKYVTLVRLSARHVQDRTAINVKAVHLDIMRVQQKLALLVQLNVLLAQEEIIISA